MPFYRVWFYTLVMVGITLFSPLLFLGTVREHWYKIYFTGARWWGMFVLFGMGFMPKVERRTQYVPGASYMFVANHVSMIDIMLMLYVANRPFVFVGKKELAKIPIFGFFYRRGCILVDRNDPASRRSVYAQAQKRLSEGLGICIFPEGGVPSPKIDLAPFNIRVNNLAPGYIKTDMTMSSYLDSTKNKERVDRMIIKRWGQPYDLLGGILFLVSDASSYVTGIDLIIDGGWTAKGI